ncbi:MAG: YggS family pyridoxal phosphate-dependent enzyme [Micavibrio aeruginosavorus]|uniref:Pyridoxal phosphate homeostasis protein n=1 Tax=Micavibrio aeruginosavorus TaxID=349221 RepID=A0A2W5FUQ3_9BACT|nr:MAG: YggS family pyridoxal phosphate-dependent enzyme [Micavibrio aeruginosavorus]
MSIADRFSAIRNKIADQAKLIAVSKTQSAEKIQAALDCGHLLFGENRVQEAKLHWSEHRKNHTDLELHLIGPLQTNKAKEAVALFDIIQTIDRKNLVDALAKEQEKQNRNLKYFIQVNTGAEEQKAGIGIEEFPALLKYAQGKGLNIIGLMCIPPVDENPQPHFDLLRKLAGENNLKELSMGMSDDFETAINCGATYVRIGSALFGAREA